MAELSYSGHFAQKTSRFVCDENVQMLLRSPEGDFKGEKRDSGQREAEQNY